MTKERFRPGDVVIVVDRDPGDITYTVTHYIGDTCWVKANPHSDYPWVKEHYDRGDLDCTRYRYGVTDWRTSLRHENQFLATVKHAIQDHDTGSAETA